jgi:hypothetical protein
MHSSRCIWKELWAIIAMKPDPAKRTSNQIGCRNLFQYALVREDQTVMISLSSGALFLQFVNMVAGPLRWYPTQQTDMSKPTISIARRDAKLLTLLMCGDAFEPI